MQGQVRAFTKGGTSTELDVTLVGNELVWNGKTCYKLPDFIGGEIKKIFSIPYGECLYGILTDKRYYIIEETRVININPMTFEIDGKINISTKRFNLVSGSIKQGGKTYYYLLSNDTVEVVVSNTITIQCSIPEGTILRILSLINSCDGNWYMNINGTIQQAKIKNSNWKINTVNLLEYKLEARLNDPYGYLLTDEKLSLIKLDKRSIYLSLRRELRATENFTLFDEDLVLTNLELFNLVASKESRLVLPTGYGSLISIDLVRETGQVVIADEYEIQTAISKIPITTNLIRQMEKEIVIHDAYSPCLKRR